ncbi:hypothetical protein GCM10023108_43860 [Saccharopolyspora hordei]
MAAIPDPAASAAPVTNPDDNVAAASNPATDHTRLRVFAISMPPPPEPLRQIVSRPAVSGSTEVSMRERIRTRRWIRKHEGAQLDRVEIPRHLHTNGGHALSKEDSIAQGSTTHSHRVFSLMTEAVLSMLQQDFPSRVSHQDTGPTDQLHCGRDKGS